LLQATSLPSALLAELRIFRRHSPSMLDDDLPGLRLRRLAGGRKNQTFAWDGPAGEICLKLYSSGNRERAIREYRALLHLADSGITAAPQPLWHDPDPELPAVATTMLPGQKVPELDEPVSALRAVVGVLAELRRIPVGPFTDTPRVGAAKDIVHQLMGTWPGQLDDHADDPHTYDMRLLLDAWSECGAAATLLDPAPKTFSRGDPNRSNWLWDGTRIRAGALYVAFFGYLGAKLHILTVASLGGVPTVVLVVVIVVLSFLLGHLAYPVGEAMESIVPRSRKKGTPPRSSYAGRPRPRAVRSRSRTNISCWVLCICTTRTSRSTSRGCGRPLSWCATARRHCCSERSPRSSRANVRSSPPGWQCCFCWRHSHWFRKAANSGSGLG